MTTVLAASLCVSCLILLVSIAVPSREPTNWPLAILAHLLWPATLVLVAVEARRAARRSSLP